MESENKPNTLSFDLFGELLEDAWKKEWVGMPEFVQEDLQPEFQVTINFECKQDMEDFSKLLGQTVTPDRRGIWFPEAEIGRFADKRYDDMKGI